MTCEQCHKTTTALATFSSPDQGVHLLETQQAHFTPVATRGAAKDTKTHGPNKPTCQELRQTSSELRYAFCLANFNLSACRSLSTTSLGLPEYLVFCRPFVVFEHRKPKLQRRGAMLKSPAAWSHTRAEGNETNSSPVTPTVRMKKKVGLARKGGMAHELVRNLLVFHVTRIICTVECKTAAGRNTLRSQTTKKTCVAPSQRNVVHRRRILL